VLGTVVKVGLPAAQRLLPFKDARIIQRINNILDELASGVRNFDKAREFENRLGQLPAKGPGYYREFTVQPPLGVSGRGAERLVVGRGGEVYYTPNQYGSFARVQ
jgi:guanyl-specific ribonuclease Sa